MDRCRGAPSTQPLRVRFDHRRQDRARDYECPLKSPERVLRGDRAMTCDYRNRQSWDESENSELRTLESGAPSKGARTSDRKSVSSASCMVLGRTRTAGVKSTGGARQYGSTLKARPSVQEKIGPMLIDLLKDRLQRVPCQNLIVLAGERRRRKEYLFKAASDHWAGRVSARPNLVGRSDPARRTLG